MQLLYPIQAILMYFAILFAPEDVRQITIGGDLPAPLELTREGSVWTVAGRPVAVAGELLLTNPGEGKEELKISDFARTLTGHDWSRQPKTELSEGTTLEKSGDGFTLRRSSATQESNGVYQIRYVRSAAAAGAGDITVNVFGEVRNPGAWKIVRGGSVLDALAAAGGWTSDANLKRVKRLHGAAGEVPELSVHDVSAVLDGKTAAVVLEDRDSVLVTALPDNAPRTPPPAEKPADQVPAVTAWLGRLDAGEYAETHQQLASRAAAAVTAKQWEDSIAAERKPLGRVESRKPAAQRELDGRQAGLPAGEKVWALEFATDFENKKTAIETVVLEKDGGTWKPTGYFIR